MKTLLPPIFFFFLLLWVLGLSLTGCDAHPDVVYDTKGKALIDGGQYRLLFDGYSVSPEFFRFFPGCVFYLTLSAPDYALPITINLATPNPRATSSLINTASPLSLSYAKVPVRRCSNSTLHWHVSMRSSPSSPEYVLVGAKEAFEEDNVALQEGWFFLKTSPVSDAYALVFCTNRDGTGCANLGIHFDAKLGTFVFGIDPSSIFVLRLESADESSTSHVSISMAA